MVGSLTARATAAACAFVLTAIHLSVLEHVYIHGGQWIGALMALACIALLCISLILVAGGPPHIIKPRLVAWPLGSAICGLLFLGFLARSTWGLPGWHPHNWPALGIGAMFLEAVFIVCAVGTYLARGRNRVVYPDDPALVNVPASTAARTAP